MTEKYGRSAAYCTGTNYNLTKISEYLSSTGYRQEICSKNALYCNIPAENHDCSVVIFSYGCIVFWGTDEAHEQLFLKQIFAYLTEPLPIPILDEFHFSYDSDIETVEIDEENDLIILGAAINDPEPHLILMALSYGLAQSVKLDLFENIVDTAISNTKTISQELMNRGKISLSKRTLSRKIGELFEVKNLINLHSDILDTPEFFWRRPKYEPYYSLVIRFVDISTRIYIINKRIDVINELYMILSQEQHQAHSARMEWIIIILIATEVILVLLRDFLEII